MNAATGLALFGMDAEHKATQTVFFVKLAFIALALVCYARMRRQAFFPARRGGSANQW